MAGFLAFVPLYAAELGMDGAALPLAVYALIVVGLRIAFAKLPDQVGAAQAVGRARSSVAAAGLADDRRSFASPIGLLVGTAVFAAGVAFLFPALLSLAVSRVAETERGVGGRHDERRSSTPRSASRPAIFGGDRPRLGLRRRVPARARPSRPLGAVLLTVRRASLVAADPGGVRSGA